MKTSARTGLGAGKRRWRLSSKAVLHKSCIDLPACAGVTALRGCLEMSDDKAIENLFLQLGQGLSATHHFRLADDQLGICGNDEITVRIKAALRQLSTEQTIVVAEAFAKLPPSDQGLYPLMASEISMATKATVPQHFAAQCLAWRTPPVAALATMEKIETCVISMTGGNPLYMKEFLQKAIRSALDNHSSRELETLSGRLKESDISDDRHVRWFREVVDDRMEELKRELASKYLLSAPVVIAPKNKN